MFIFLLSAKSANALCFGIFYHHSTPPHKILSILYSLDRNFNLYSDEDGVKHIRIKARPNKWHKNDCLSVTSHVLLMTNIPGRPNHLEGLGTVGRCVNRALHDLEPERSRRLDGLVNIGIDETSYKKGHRVCK